MSCIGIDYCVTILVESLQKVLRSFDSQVCSDGKFSWDHRREILKDFV